MPFIDIGMTGYVKLRYFPKIPTSTEIHTKNCVFFLTKSKNNDQIR